MSNYLNSTFSKVFISIAITASIVLISINILLGIQLEKRFQVFLEHQEEIGLGIRQPLGRLEPPPKEPQFVKITEDFLNGHRRAVLLSSLVGIVVSGIVGFVVSKGITNPIKSLQKTIKSNANKRFKIQAEVKGSTEIQDLINEFNVLIGEINKVEKLREELVFDVAHELKTPITKIRGKIEGMIDGIYTKSDEDLNNLILNVGQLEYLIEKLQEIIEIKSQSSNITKNKVNLRKLVESSLDGFTKKGITKEIQIPNDVEISANPHMFRELLDNIFDNAFKYSSSGNIKIEWQHPYLVISDEGQGIPDEDLPFIFERFYRSEKSRNRQTGGIGLGLSIVKEIADIHNWEVDVESKVGQGTTFRINLFSEKLDSTNHQKVSSINVKS